MSLLTSLASGTSGLNSASSELSVVGDNIANANTIGFKAERAAFEDALAQNVIGGTGQIGLGSRLQSVQKMMSEGALQNTGIATDLALQGAGFFTVAGTTSDGRQGTYLTRAGQFSVDRSGYLVNLDGLRVQGFMADATGQTTTAVSDMQVGNASAAPRATGSVTITANIDADSPILPAATPFDPSQAVATSNFSTSATVYDSLGRDTQVQVYFRRTGDGTWDWHALVDASAADNAVGGVPVEVAGGTLAFDSQGRLQTQTQNNLTFDPVGSPPPQQIAFNLGDAIDQGGTGLAGVTQFGAASATTFVGQDGYGSGQLSSIQIDRKGIVQGVFTNGQTRTLAQVAVARVTAPESLERAGGNLYAITRDSGDAVMGTAGDGGRAFIASGTLEQSNVDIAEQFVRMIAAQRAFEANSKTITTADQLLSELIQMKR